ncbi:MAG: hypothetical protein PG981_000781 [Wolbachia endosymbiont of Ctenocephalides orientis wCori]|nr:MAG: hypothetical protein PG981_000781 [Wolbachia endosymbiont of Ctenocephalides orientis wCori]
MNAVPEVLRTGIKLFMWSYDAAKNESVRDMSYIKEAYNKMKESGHDTPYEIASMEKDFGMADCLVTFLQEKHPSFIRELLFNARGGNIQTEFAKFEQRLNKPEIAREFKKWMEKASGNEIAAELVPDNEVMNFSEHKIQINLKYDGEKIDQSKLSGIKSTIQDAIRDFDSTFGINNSQPWHNIPNKVNVFVFNTESDYKNYLKELNVYDKGGTGLTTLGRGSDTHVYFYLQDNQFDTSCKTLKHELGHALTIINSYWETGGVLQTAMHEGIANYVAGLKDGQHVNDHKDVHALSTIKNQSLKPDEILRNNSKGSHYYDEAEQVIKFLEDKHHEVLDNLLKSLSTHGISRAQGNGFVDDFFTELKSYVQEFKDWVDDQLNNRLQSGDGRALNTQQAEQPSVEENTRSKRSMKEDEGEQGEVVIESVIENMNDSGESYSKHPLKIKPSMPIEAGKYKVELQVTYKDITKFYDAMKDKYHASR